MHFRPNASAVRQVPMRGGKRLRKTWRTGLYYDEKMLSVSSVYLKARFPTALSGVIEISDWRGVGV